MLQDRTLVLPDMELGYTPAEPDTAPDDQKIDEKISLDITDKYAKYADGVPDGGFKAWSVIVASMLATFCTYVAFIFLPGLVTGRLFDLGHFKIPYFLASCGLIVCTFLTAECKQYWQFFLAQGLFTGLFSGVIYGQAISVVSHWFSKKKGMALGVVSIGSSLGGVLFPIAGQNLIPLVGCVFTLSVSGIFYDQWQFLDRRLPPVNVKGGLLNLPAFRNPVYTYLLLLTYLPVSATAIGMSDTFSFYLVAISNAASGFGRLSAGFLADRIGPLSAMIPFTALAGILTFAWPYASSQGALIGVSVIYGIASGAYVSLIVAPAMAMGDVRAINARTGGFKDPGFFAGGVVIFSVLLLFVVRYLQLGRLYGKC
ncbi:MFS general substrate transporter [Pisolithus microcarpus]|nr:MFS general substrate transporter [Pisolithus microcarpus]